MSVCQHCPVAFMFIQMFQKHLSFLTCAQVPSTCLGLQDDLEGGRSLEGEPRGPGGYLFSLAIRSWGAGSVGTRVCRHSVRMSDRTLGQSVVRDTARKDKQRVMGKMLNTVL